MNLSTQEKEILKSYLKSSPLVLIRLKSQAILMREKSMHITDIADIFSRNRSTVSRWMSDFQTRRLASIFTGHKNNENASKLTRDQKSHIQQVLKQSPSEYGLPREFWDVPQLKTYVQATFGDIYESDQSYHFLLRFSNLSFKYPSTFDQNRDEKLIEKRMKEITKEIQPYFTDDTWEVFVADETRMELEALTRRAWLKRGEKTVIKVNRKKQSQSYLGLLSQKTYHCHVYELSWQNQEEILKALKQFLKLCPKKHICIIWDNARFHTGKLIREELKKRRHS